MAVIILLYKLLGTVTQCKMYESIAWSILKEKLQRIWKDICTTFHSFTQRKVNFFHF